MRSATTERGTSEGVGQHRLIRHLDLFSGIGGFALAARMAGGFETVGFCEIDDYAQAVLRKNFPGIPIHDDVRKIRGDEFGTVQLVSAGYPCQPFSLAGLRRGEGDDRHLWPEVRRIVAVARPDWVLCENVAGHVSMGLDDVLSDLETLGYSTWQAVIPACAVDARHRRDRVWIVAHLEREGLEGLSGNGADGNEPGWIRAETGGPTGEGGLCEADANTTRELPYWSGVTRARGRREYTNIYKWLPEPAVGRVAHGIPDRVDRLKGLGNAIVPQVAAEILRCMMRVDSVSNPYSAETSNDN